MTDEPTAPPEKQTTTATIQVPWRTVAIGSIASAVASLAALVVVVAIADADLLATVALSLAILAFVIQIIVFLVQSSSASQQMVQSQALYAETGGLLREVRATAQATQEMVAGQFDRVLQHALREIPVGIKKTEGDTEAPAVEELAGRFERAIREAIGARFPAQARIVSGPQASEEDQQKAAWLRSFPLTREEWDDAMKQIEKLSPRAVALLTRYGEDLARTLRVGGNPGLWWTSPKSRVRQELLDGGLVEPVEPPVENRTASGYGRLTPLGERVVRALLAQGKAPPYLKDGGIDEPYTPPAQGR